MCVDLGLNRRQRVCGQWAAFFVTSKTLLEPDRVPSLAGGIRGYREATAGTFAIKTLPLREGREVGNDLDGENSAFCQA